MTTDYFQNYQSFTGGERTPPSPIGTSYPSKADTWGRGLARDESNPVSTPNNAHDVSPVSPLSPLDQRRITPTLHASLVSEILNLRRELEAKDGYIDNLEADLQATKSENEKVNSRLVASTRTTRSSERDAEQTQKYLQEATDQLSLERDTAVAANRETREKLEALTRKSRRQEADLGHWQRAWDDERQKWEDERRQLETRVHVTESRLRTIVEEISAQQDFATKHNAQQEAGAEAVDDAFQDSGIGNDSEVASLRSSTTHDHHHHRTRSGASLLSNPRSSSSPTKTRRTQGQGFSLADELGFEEEDDFDLDEFDHLEDDQMLERQRASGLDSDAKAKRILGLDMVSDDSCTSRHQDVSSIHHPEYRASTRTTNEQRASIASVSPSAIANRERRDSKSHVKYVDTGVQPFTHLWEQTRQAMFAESLQQRKDSATSAFTQTSTVETQLENHYRSSETQTDGVDIRTSSRDFAQQSHSARSPIEVPLIAIHPPQSRPSSLEYSVLPPGTRSVACQTDVDLKVHSNDASVQTEAHPRDSALVNPIPGIAIEPQGEIKTTIVRPSHLKAVELRSPILLSSPRVFENIPSSQNPPLSRGQHYGIKSSQSENLLSDMQDLSDLDSDDSEMQANVASSEDIFGATPSTHHYNSLARRSKLPMTVPEGREISPRRDSRSVSSSKKDQWAMRNYSTNSNHSHPWTSSFNDGRTKNVHAQLVNVPKSRHSRNQSVETNASSIFSVQSMPPPIPRRSSSKFHLDVLSDDRSSPSNNDSSPVVRQTQTSSSVNRGPAALRKVQSANAMRAPRRASPPKRRRKTPPLTPIRSSLVESPTAGQSSSMEFTTEPQMATTPATDYDDISSRVVDQEEMQAEELVDDTTLVDAVASVMVGEWMWKYVQKRKSFGLGDSSHTFKEDGLAKNNGTRHKRWVWLSPYERTIMWSPKQPTSGAALMGKNGRKLQIKTILDVKDNNPMPKGESLATVFDRSIIVLTATRALKLTASSKDRHYLWLMALSFLANPSQLPPQVPRVPDAKPKQVKANNGQTAPRNPVIEKSIDKANVRNFSEPIRSSRASVFGAETTQSVSQTVMEPPMRTLESYPKHTRKRSITGGPSRIMSSSAGLRSLTSLVTPTSPSFPFNRSRANSGAAPTSPRKNGRTGTLNSHREPEIQEDVHEDEVGMVRMEAFVDRSYKDGVLYVPPLPVGKPVPRPRPVSQLSGTGVDSRKRHGYVIDDSGRDPFMGF